MDSGVYIAVFYLPLERNVTVGRKGRYRFKQGMYFYVGTAQKNLSARLERHARKHKPLRWHIDYLSVHAPMIGALTVSGSRDRECQLAAELSCLYELVIPGFGASDCRCSGHLFHTSAL
jgi:sugar fermentation stimulation protein A